MKKYILFLIFVPFLIINGCDDNEEVMGGIDPVSNVECIPFIGSVTLNWTNPENSDYYYTLNYSVCLSAKSPEYTLNYCVYCALIFGVCPYYNKDNGKGAHLYTAPAPTRKRRCYYACKV